MEIGIGFGPSDKFDHIKSNAHWTRVHLDTSFRPDSDDIKICSDHVQDCLNHPTTGLLARRQYITKKPYNYPEYALRNKMIINNNKKITSLQNYFKDLVKVLYPKTNHIRQYIIDNDRVVLDYVAPIKKYTSADKLKIFLKRFF